MEVVRHHADVTSTERAREALANGDWSGAFTLLSTLEAERELTATELELLAFAAYGAGELEASLTAWEQLHAVHVASGDHLAAAGAAATLAMYLMMDTGLMAPVRGWLTRAERLLEGQDEHPVHALVAMVRTYERIMCGDLVAARRWSTRTVDVGERHDAEGPVAIGRIATARLLIFDGHIDQGLQLLDDAAVALVSSSLDPLTIGMVYCELICAMQGLAQYDRAEEWTAAMDRWRHADGFGGINGRCRVHRAEMLRLRGACEAAEEEALHACAELRPWMRREYGWPLTELGTIRLRRGDLDGAEEAFLDAHQHGWDPQPGLALLRLAQGDVVGSRVLIREALDRPADLPSKERPPRSELCRAPLLEAEVEIAVAAGDLPAARQAATELTGTAELFRSRALDASASLARGRVALADGDHRAAILACERAVTAWCDVGAPYETAVARLVLAETARAAGDEARAALESHAATTALQRIGAWRRRDDETNGHPAGGGTADEATTGPAQSATVFRLDGDTRTVAFDGHEVLLRDLKGMRYLARLLAQPGREFHVLDISRAETGVADGTRAPAIDADGLRVAASDGLGPVLDDRACESYRRRLAEVDDDIEEATRRGDTERAALAAADRDYLITELSRAYGLGGRARVAGTTSERARASVTRSLRYALARIAEHHPSLAEHLEQTVRTGTYCSYVPDPRIPIRWQV
jgi:tetratricopeptide (TPR) repeat protein